MAWNAETIKGFDAVIIATHHQAIQFNELAQWAECIIDTRNAMVNLATRPGQVWKA